jgi:hypothetical protein
VRKVAIIVSVFLAFGVAWACGSSNPLAPVAPANLVVQGTLSVAGCQVISPNGSGIVTCQTFSGVIQNNGTGCAANIRGVTATAWTSNVQQIGSAEWSYSAKVRAGEQFVYSGGPINVGSPQGAWIYDTKPTWDNVSC